MISTPVIVIISVVALLAITAKWVSRDGGPFDKKEDVSEKFPYPTHFTHGWDTMSLPLMGIVAIIDDGEPAVGLSAMQMSALDVGRGVVLLEFEGRKCEAKVWNAFGPDATKGETEIRITKSLAKKLHCEVGDGINFVKVVTANLPVQISFR